MTTRTARKPTPRGRSKKSPAPGPRPRQNPPPEPGQAHQLARSIAGLAQEKKGTEVLLLDMRGMTAYADCLVIASGDSERQVSAMAEHVEVKLKERGIHLLGKEGEQTGHWVLLDYGEVVAHFFYSEVRAFYDLEGLWADAPREQLS